MSAPKAHHKVVIIGSGPAGLTAAIYAARANLQPLCIEGWSAGGQLMITNDVENYPGFPKGITGPELMKEFRAQAERFGTALVTADVTAVDFSQRPFKVFVEDDLYTADAIIISTGASARWLDIPSEKSLMGRGVSACAVCDGAFFKNEDVIVVGGGDTAMEEANYLTGMCKSVTLVHRRHEFRASKIMQDRVFANPKIKVVWDSAIDEIKDASAGRVTSAVIKNLRTGEKTEIPTGAVFVAIGHDPNTQLFRGVLELHDNGYIKTRPGTTQTSLEGVFAAGDVQDVVYRQAVTAAGTGCMAALEVERWLAASGAH
ncbi:MAG: thioredoxin-disulfide reductase [Deltaproteobacteria bacterium]|nr:thioredoxin-disulfide reductase [Deltaproteobacteria bacterium]